MNLHDDPISPVIFWITCVFLLGVIGRRTASFFKQPSVLGELLVGIIFGNILYYFDMPLIIALRDGVYTTNVGQVAYVIDVFAGYGILFLLFMVGLESSIKDFKSHGLVAFRVALLGVIAPMLLGFITMCYFMPNLHINTDLFIAATLAATSIGITAQVLRQMQQLQSAEAKIILGAAMIDDVLGLIILSFVSQIVIYNYLSVYSISIILIKILLFFVISMVFGSMLLKHLVKLFSFMTVWEQKLSISFFFLMFLSWLATQLQLSAIVGAFMAGILIHDGLFSDENKTSGPIKQLLAPFEAILAPIFFINVGMQVPLDKFFDLKVLAIALVLSIAAILGKIISGLGANSNYKRLFIGIGMLPRGEVGLIFASIGRVYGVFTEELFTAIILMVILTTVITPVLLQKYK